MRELKSRNLKHVVGELTIDNVECSLIDGWVQDHVRLIVFCRLFEESRQVSPFDEIHDDEWAQPLWALLNLTPAVYARQWNSGVLTEVLNKPHFVRNLFGPPG